MVYGAASVAIQKTFCKENTHEKITSLALALALALTLTACGKKDNTAR